MSSADELRLGSAAELERGLGLMLGRTSGVAVRGKGSGIGCWRSAGSSSAAASLASAASLPLTSSFCCTAGMEHSSSSRALTARTVSSPSTLSWCFAAPWATVIFIFQRFTTSASTLPLCTLPLCRAATHRWRARGAVLVVSACWRKCVGVFGVRAYARGMGLHVHREGYCGLHRTLDPNAGKYWKPRQLYRPY